MLILIVFSQIFASMLASTIHCRHLMVWKIFAPRFIFEAVNSLIMFAGIIVAFMLVMRVHVAVERLLRGIAIDKTVFDRLAKFKRDEELRKAGKLPKTVPPPTTTTDDANALLQQRLEEHLAEREKAGGKQHAD